MAAMLKAACDGEYDFVGDIKEYALRTARIKEMLVRNGFHIVYDKDVDEDVSDGFFFTIGYKDMEGGELLRELLYYGVSSISLATTGSGQKGVRACTSRMTDELYSVLEERMTKILRRSADKCNAQKVFNRAGHVSEAVEKLVLDIVRVVLIADKGDALIERHSLARIADVFFGNVGIVGEVDYALLSLLDLLTLLLKHRIVKQLDIEIVTDGFKVSVLLSTENVARAAYFHIAKCNSEACAEFGVFLNGFKSFLGYLGDISVLGIGEIGIGAAGGSTHTASELMELGKS